MKNGMVSSVITAAFTVCDRQPLASQRAKGKRHDQLDQRDGERRCAASGPRPPSARSRTARTRSRRGLVDDLEVRGSAGSCRRPEQQRQDDESDPHEQERRHDPARRRPVVARTSSRRAGVRAEVTAPSPRRTASMPREPAACRPGPLAAGSAQALRKRCHSSSIRRRCSASVVLKNGFWNLRATLASVHFRASIWSCGQPFFWSRIRRRGPCSGRHSRGRAPGRRGTRRRGSSSAPCRRRRGCRGQRLGGT